MSTHVGRCRARAPPRARRRFPRPATFSGLLESSRTRRQSEIAQNRAGQLVVAQVGIEAQALVGFHRVGALVLQLVGAQLVQQADAAALLVLVDQQAAALSGDALRARFPAARGNRSAGCETRRRSGTANGCAPAAARPSARSPISSTTASSSAVVRARPSKSVDPEVPELGWKIRFGHFLQPERGRIVHELAMRKP